ncbi:hypothetical protein CAPN005_09570 [Capnocytophaga cynodegmi]|nr:hypothetical protein CAPN005_09570 [Capnocytophaga cynodegmi]
MLLPKLRTYVVLGFSVSKILISNFLEADIGDIIGKFSIGGEMISCLRKSLITTNSSKISRILLRLNCVTPDFGSAKSKTGGFSSLGPPVGEPLLAHCQNTDIKIIKNKK